MMCEDKRRKGKERKGKERKGKERKGKERKGKERKGKERKGKERKGKEIKLQDMRESKFLNQEVIFFTAWLPSISNFVFYSTILLCNDEFLSVFFCLITVMACRCFRSRCSALPRRGPSPR